jgi:uncharacterized protein (DUF2252 family)
MTTPPQPPAPAPSTTTPVVQRRDAALLLPTTIRRTTVADREAAGRAARKQRPRSGLGQWSPAPDRPDPVAVLGGQETTRVQALLPLRHTRMSASEFAFYRGGAAIMAGDLASLPDSGLVTQLCGDAHLSNFGVFAAPDRSLVFDVNDFDETHPGPFEWDVMRLATSFVLAGRDLSMDASVVADAAKASAQGYRDQMAVYAGMADVDVWYDRVDVDKVMEWAQQEGIQKSKAMQKVTSKARSRTAWSAIAKMTTTVDGQRRFLNLPPLLMPMPPDPRLHDLLDTLMDQYRQTLPHDRQHLLLRYHAIDFAHKVVGVGSVGMLAFVILMQGRDENDLLVLQAKQAVHSVLEPFTDPSVYPMAGERVVAGQQLMQAASDIFLGWVRGFAGRDYYVRQLRDMKFAPDPATFTPDKLRGFALLCGRTLARAHARGGDSVSIAGYLGSSDKFDNGVRDFALAYADQVAQDFAAYQQAITDGRVSLGNRAEESTYSMVVDPETGVSVVASPPPESAPDGTAGAAPDAEAS